MPHRRESAQITDAWRARQYGLVDATLRAVGAGWANLDRQDLDGSFRRWLTATVQTVTLAQREAVRLADAYLAAYVSSELGARQAPQGLDPDEWAGQSWRGNALRDSFAPALITMKVAILQKRPQRDVLLAGLARAVKATRSEVMQASRRSLAAAIAADEQIVGARRVTRGTCGACMALAGETTDGSIDTHPNCQCVAEPIIRGLRETVHRPTGEQLWNAKTIEEQNRFFVGRGGEQKAELIRSGAVTLAALVARSRGPGGEGQITEAPLDDVE